MLVRENNKISVACRSRKVEKVKNSRTVLQDIAQAINSLLTSNKMKCIIEVYYAEINCILDLRSFGTKVKDFLGGDWGDEENGYLDVCDVNPILDGNGGCNKCRVVMNKNRRSYKDVRTDDVPKFVLGIYKEIMEEFNSKKEK